VLARVQKRGEHPRMPAFALTIFVGAFLLFQVQPLVGKFILPWFGGGPGVWTTCMVFFQALLLGGYAYAHVLSRFRPRAQAIAHLALVAASLVLLPITPSDAWKPHGGENPVVRILALLTITLGLPYFVLSATSPLLQQWFSQVSRGRSPYRLYALSNVGSLLALITYPLVIENHLARSTQATVWGCGLVFYALCCSACGWKLWKAEPNAEGRRQNAETDSADGGTGDIALSPQPSTLNYLLWLLLPACASVLLLATTNKLCQDITVIPFLWVLPLTLYLLSFVICFDSPRWYARWPFALALLAAFGLVCWAFLRGSFWPVWRLVAVYSGALFVCCMVCHGELYRLRPEPRRLTSFYLMIAAGGALGGLFVAVGAPLLFRGYYELQWGLLACGLLFLLISVRARFPAQPRQETALAPAGSGSSGLGWQSLACVVAALAVVVVGVLIGLRRDRYPTQVYSSRNFYGVLRLFEERIQDPQQHILGLMHGHVWHGWQFRDPGQAKKPTLYYNEQSGVGLALSALRGGGRRIGVVGLGIGTLASYARPGDCMRFYEINPEVERIAASPFTCLSRCRGKVELAPGDARLSLEREPPQQFDLLVLDAFSSDAIPAHLLTREAFELYARHLKTNGVIAVHISNPYLDLEPVLGNAARSMGYAIAAIEFLPRPNQWWLLPSLWVLLSHDRSLIDSPTIRDAARPLQPDCERVRLWTDDFTSVFPLLKPKDPAEVEPGAAQADLDRATRLAEQGNLAQAVAQYRLVLKAHPNLVVALNNLAWLLATSPDATVRNGPEAVQCAEKACRLTRYCVPRLVGTLAAAYAETGRFPEAVATARKACARAGDEPALLKRNRELLEMYRKGQAFHEAANSSG
jgi:hypothetical protein